MDFQQILQRLSENFGLKQNHVVILNLLNKHDKLTADQIIAKSGIPKGGIYEYLNDLIKHKLISKDESIPAKYTCTDFKNRVLDFLHLKFNDFVKRESEMLDLIDSSNVFDFVFIKTKEEYTFHVMDLINNAEYGNFMVRDKSAPFEMYPEKDEEFIKFREVLWKKRPTISGAENQNLSLMQLRSFKDAWRQKKPFRYIITKSGYDYFFDILKNDFKEKTVKSMSDEILKRMKRSNIDMKIIDEKTPYNLFISDKKVLFVVARSSKILTGFVSTNKEVIEVYQNLFDSVWNRQIPIKPITEYLEN